MEKNLKLLDGTKIKLYFSIYSSFNNVPEFSCRISVCEPKKRTFRDIINTDDFSWRKLNNLEKHQYKLSKRRELISDEDMNKYLQEYVLSIIPHVNNIR